MRRLPGIVAFVALTLTSTAPAVAKVSHSSPYSYEQTFGSALRLLKVDLDVEVTELNPDWGFVTFNYVSTESGKRKNRGSFTFIKNEDDREVTVVLQIPDMPSYHEQLIMGKLKHKLEDEHGEPPRRPDPPKDKRPKDKEPPKDEPDQGEPGEPAPDA